MKNNEHEFYLGLTKAVAEQSYAERSKVGAIIVKDGNIIAFGYNGTPAGFRNVCEDFEGKTKREVLHAESNAITKCAKFGIACNDAVLYTTFSPCFDCAKLIVQAGIREVYFAEYYRDQSGLSLLQEAGITYNLINNEPTTNS